MITSKAVRLEKFIDARIKYLKLEAEGAEPEVLDGLGDKLKLAEDVTADLGYKRGLNSESTLAPVTNYLLQNGFELIDLRGVRLCALYRHKLLVKDVIITVGLRLRQLKKLIIKFCGRLYDAT